MKMTKERSIRYHAFRRARQRYGVPAPGRLCLAIRSYIESGQARLLERVSNRVSNYGVVIDGQVYAVGYDHERKLVITFLPRRSAYYRAAVRWAADRGLLSPQEESDGLPTHQK